MAGFLNKIKGTIRGGAGAGRGDNPHHNSVYNTGTYPQSRLRGRVKPDQSGVLRDKHGQSYKFGSGYDASDPDFQRNMNQHTGGYYNDPVGNDPYHEMVAQGKDPWSHPDEHKFLSQMHDFKTKTYGSYANDPLNSPSQNAARKKFKDQGNESYTDVMEKGKNPPKLPF